MKRVVLMLACVFAVGCPGPVKGTEPPSPASPDLQLICTPVYTLTAAAANVTLFSTRTHTFMRFFNRCVPDRGWLIDAWDACNGPTGCGLDVNPAEIGGLVEWLSLASLKSASLSKVPLHLYRQGEEMVIQVQRGIAGKALFEAASAPGPEGPLGGRTGAASSGAAGAPYCLDFAPCLPGQCEGGPVPVERLQPLFEPCDCEAVCEAKAKGQLPADCECETICPRCG